jgi:Do/DeqQ family serine protease
LGIQGIIKMHCRKYMKIFGLIVAVVVGGPLILGLLGFWKGVEAAGTEAVALVSDKKEQTCVCLPSYANAVERALPAVVSIHTSREMRQEIHPLMRDPMFRQFFGPSVQQGPVPREQPGLGSGVIVNAKGYILTNHHVIKDAEEIKIKLYDGRSVEKVKIVGIDPESDLAVLKIDLDKLPIIPMGDSGSLRIGDVVLAMGNPFGVGQTVTQGIVSALQRGEGFSIHEHFIQTDASINPGNSGGALVNAQGLLVGINAAIYTNSGGGTLGIGFAIPIDYAKDVLDQLVNHGQVVRGFLGVSVRSLNDSLRKELSFPKGKGVVVVAVVRGGPASTGGIQPGDILLSINGQATPDPAHLLGVTAKLEPKKPYKVVIARDGQELDLRVTVIQRPQQKTPELKKERLDDPRE